MSTTPSQTVGPFYGYALPFAKGGEIAPAGHPDALTVHGYVHDGAGAPVPDALIEIWQPDWGARQALAGWQRVATDAQGSFAFAMPAPDKGQVHANLTIFARGLLRELYTRIYLHPGDDVAALDLPTAVPPARRATLAGKRSGENAYEWNIRLQGEGETVFFEI